MASAAAPRPAPRWRCVLADGKPFQIPQALEATQDSEHGRQQQIPGWKPHQVPHPRIGRPQIADQVEIGGGVGVF
jgi:hypothetical protein